jgi:hypothetical protein
LTSEPFIEHISPSPPSVLSLNKHSSRKQSKNTYLVVHRIGAAAGEELEITEGVNNPM